jgi:hypothetical protein
MTNQTSTTAELRKNTVAALLVLAVILAGSFIVVLLL